MVIRVNRKRGIFQFHSQIPGARVRREFLLACAHDAARRFRRRPGHLNFILINDREMARLHRTYMNIAGTTDVLTFDLSENTKSPVEGDVYICLDQARRQAEYYRVPLYLEIARLAVHGVLHLAGWEDRTDVEKRRMRSLEDRTLEVVRKLHGR